MSPIASAAYCATTPAQPYAVDVRAPAPITTTPPSCPPIDVSRFIVTKAPSRSSARSSAIMIRFTAPGPDQSTARTTMPRKCGNPAALLHARPVSRSTAVSATAIATPSHTIRAAPARWLEPSLCSMIRAWSRPNTMSTENTWYSAIEVAR